MGRRTSAKSSGFALTSGERHAKNLLSSKAGLAALNDIE